jgi:Icc-related predicted phosphoesterase
MAGGQRITRVVCAGAPAGSTDAIDALLSKTHEGDVMAFVGNLGGLGPPESLRAVFKVLARSGRRVYWTPGPEDAPIERYLREAANIETIVPSLRGLHGGLAFTPDGHVVVAGFGGEVSDNPDAPRDENERLSYPRWEPEYRLKILNELDEHQFVLLFATPPAHDALGPGGSDVIFELIGTYRPRLAVCGGPQATAMLGRSLVVCPGNLENGEYAVADISNHDVKFEHLTAGAATS